MTPRQCWRGYLRHIALIVALNVIAASATTPTAQQIAGTKLAPPDSTDTSSSGLHTLQQALNAGLHLIGVYSADDGHWVNDATIRDRLGNETHTQRNFPRSPSLASAVCQRTPL